MAESPKPDARCRCGHVALTHGPVVQFGLSGERLLTVQQPGSGACFLSVGEPEAAQRCPCLAFAEPLPDPYFASYVAEQQAKRKRRGFRGGD